MRGFVMVGEGGRACVRRKGRGGVGLSIMRGSMWGHAHGGRGKNVGDGGCAGHSRGARGRLGKKEGPDMWAQHGSDGRGSKGRELGG